jgi:hypothetical protein
MAFAFLPVASYLQQQGWERTGSGPSARWDGWYRTRFGSFRGKIECSTPPKFSVKQPPEGLARHRHRSCFSGGKSGGWWNVHFAILPKDLDSGVMTIERILHEAFLLSQKAS